MGRPTCETCKMTCLCGNTRSKQGQKCTDCLRVWGAQRKAVIKDCADCGGRFTSKANGRYCTACTNIRRRHPCADCGVSIDWRAKVCRQCWGKAHQGPRSAHWRGGRPQTTYSGYRLVKSPGHPRAKPKNGNYVPEHQLVMEEMLDRYLEPGENVHHRNGVRDDNRPENLELWLVHQPAGQRVEDIADWAEDILRRYRPHLLRSPLLVPLHVADLTPQAGDSP